MRHLYHRQKTFNLQQQNQASTINIFCEINYTQNILTAINLTYLHV